MASRRARKTDRGVSDFDALLDALKDIKINKKSIRSTARDYNIDKTSLSRYVKKFDLEVRDITEASDIELLASVRRIASYSTPNLVFDGKQEEALVEYLKRCCHLYYGLSPINLKKLAYEYARKLDIIYPQNWDNDEMAGRSWYYGFMMRHKNLSLRSPEQTSLNRMKSFCQENVNKFFYQYSHVMEQYNFQQHRIFNMDETGFPTVPTKFGKIIAVKGLKRVGQAVAAERGTLVTMALAVNAAGNSVPPFFIFPRRKMQSYFMDGAPSTAAAACNESGWMQQNEFVKYILHFIKYTGSNRDEPTLLLLDNHISHLSIEAIDLAVEHGITMLTFPPHCSHKMQSLDVSVYGPVKRYYSNECKDWQLLNAGKALDIRHIPRLACAALDRALTPMNIKSGFSKTGIFPLKRNVFTGADFAQTNLTNKSAETQTNDDTEVTVSTSASTPEQISSSSSMITILAEIGPLKPVLPQAKSNRGRKPMKSTVLTSPENVADLKKKQLKRNDAKEEKEARLQKRRNLPEKEPAKKRTRIAAT